MNKVRKKYITDKTNLAITTMEQGTHRTISREDIHELTQIIAELFQEIDDLGNYKEIIPKLADDVWAVAKELETSTESMKLKTISACLHDIRTGHETKWYEKFEVSEK